MPLAGTCTHASMLHTHTHRDVEVLYGGTALYDYQVDNAELHDALLAIPSFLLILLVIFILSGFSGWLTLMGLYSVFSCFPWAFFAYRVVLGEDL